MAIENQDFTLHQRTNLNLRFEVSLADGVLIPQQDIDHASWGMVPLGMKEPALTVSTVTIEGDGIIVVKLTPSMTNLEPGYYWHELRVMNLGKLFVASSGKVLIKPALVGY
jgi:hypothetical protein